MRRFARSSLVVLLGVVTLASCATGRAITRPQTVGNDGAITVASFDFPESEILAQIYGQAMESNGFRVKWALGIGPRELVEPALEKDLVEFVPEYQGTMLDFLAEKQDLATADAATTNRRLRAELARRGLTALSPSPALDENGFAVTRATAERYHLRTLSDLRPVAPTLAMGGPPECRQRPLCLPGLQRVYGLRFRSFVPLDASGPLTVTALQHGEVQVALVFTTNAYIAPRGFVLLGDDRRLQPADNITPVVRTDVLRQYGTRLLQLVDAVSAKLTTTDLGQLNLLAAQGMPSRRVARTWLANHGFGLEDGSP